MSNSCNPPTSALSLKLKTIETARRALLKNFFETVIFDFYVVTILNMDSMAFSKLMHQHTEEYP